MGSGASLPESKYHQFKIKLLMLDQLDQVQRDRLLELMTHEVRKLRAADVDEVTNAVSKIQAMTRRKVAVSAIKSSFKGGESLLQIFERFCATYRQTHMTNTVFAKFCKEAGLVGSKFEVADIDMVWSQVAGKDKKVEFARFMKLLEAVADRKCVLFAQLEAGLLRPPGSVSDPPVASPTNLKGAGPSHRTSSVQSLAAGTGRRTSSVQGFAAGPGRRTSSVQGLVAGPGRRTSSVHGLVAGPSHRASSIPGVDAGPGHLTSLPEGFVASGSEDRALSPAAAGKSELRQSYSSPHGRGSFRSVGLQLFSPVDPPSIF